MKNKIILLFLSAFFVCHVHAGCMRNILSLIKGHPYRTAGCVLGGLYVGTVLTVNEFVKKFRLGIYHYDDISAYYGFEQFMVVANKDETSYYLVLKTRNTPYHPFIQFSVIGFDKEGKMFDRSSYMNESHLCTFLEEKGLRQVKMGSVLKSTYLLGRLVVSEGKLKELIK